MSGTFSLADSFRRLIAATGPISLAHYMGEANARYYASRDPFGGAGDFITAPEISQMFGEMIGVWLADIWMRAGKPERVLYVEPGPGRGTLARDALRVAARFGLTPQVHFVETSPVLREAQRALVPQAQWHDDLTTLPGDAPLLLVANEFLDALPIRQLVKTPRGWRERMVGVIDGGFTPVAGELPMDAAVPEARRSAEAGAIIETCPAAASVMTEIGRRLVAQGGAALVIDYGYDAPQLGSTLQALRAHQRHDPFAAPGEADLTALVDFVSAAEVAQREGARWLGTVGQGAWLRALGIAERAAALAKASPAHAEAVASALERLTHPEQMGALFKVMGLAGPEWPDGAGFQQG
jgi:NADH dehydrogenase [ubiquinone] 1 alpha subcomplex assembly factor 7